MNTIDYANQMVLDIRLSNRDKIYILRGWIETMVRRRMEEIPISNLDKLDIDIIYMFKLIVALENQEDPKYVCQ